MKILFFSHNFYPDIGGIEVNSEIFATEFVALGADIKLVTWTQEIGNKIFDYEVVRNPDIKKLFALFRWSDIIFENNPVMRLSWMNLFFKRPRVVGLQTWIRRMDGKKSFIDRTKKLWVNNANGVVAISEAVKKHTCKKAVIIGNPYRSVLFRLETDTALRNKDFVFLGRLVSDKGADMCIELIHQLTQKFKRQFHLTIIGDGPEMSRLKTMTSELGLKNHVEFKGYLRGKQLATVLNQYRFLLVPSRWEEPFGNVALEGMACGCIPIVSDGGGLPDAAGDAGVVFKRNSQSDFLDKTLDLLSDDKKQKQLALAAKSHLKNYTEKVVGQRYFEILMKALNQ